MSRCPLLRKCIGRRQGVPLLRFGPALLPRRQLLLALPLSPAAATSSPSSASVPLAAVLSPTVGEERIPSPAEELVEDSSSSSAAPPSAEASVARAISSEFVSAEEISTAEVDAGATEAPPPSISPADEAPISPESSAAVAATSTSPVTPVARPSRRRRRAIHSDASDDEVAPPSTIVKSEQVEWVGPPRATRSLARLSPSTLEVVEVASDDEGYSSATECDDGVRRAP